MPSKTELLKVTYQWGIVFVAQLLGSTSTLCVGFGIVVCSINERGDLVISAADNTSIFARRNDGSKGIVATGKGSHSAFPSDSSSELTGTGNGIGTTESRYRTRQKKEGEDEPNDAGGGTRVPCWTADYD